MTLSGQRGQNRLLKYLAYLAALLLLALAAWHFTRPEPLHVQLAVAERGTVEATVSNTRAGTVKACRRAKLAPPAGGQIAQLRVKKGERVKTGQILLELWNDDLQAQARLSEQQLATTATRIGEICTLAEQSGKAAARARQLRERGFISPEGLERAEADAQARQASCQAARSEIAQGRSRIEVAQAGLRRLVLRAPFDGVVADISGELGEYATPSPPGIPTPPAIDLIDDSCILISAPIDEVDAANIKAGQSGRIVLDAIKGKSFAGKVKRVAPYVLELEKQARTVEVEVEFVEPPTEENLLVGYSADVEIVHASHANVLRIPTQTLLEGNRVLLYRASDGVLEERAVTAGLTNWEYTEIASGLNEGDQIVMSLDKAGVKAGARVQPVGEK
ncbi:MAG: efflux transporter periplasmic adaptor subunit [Gallionellales bacterium RIFCSPLOWO2_12_FULL_59_22]|nr:MAG: efflux transporter periplasmic adaptor subunit [Gallionellales bacterium RIFCSPLOWO2_02_FULL_59_110]OGT12771.1 MAG: efflux transporter periplasmic adaptor subunit [Gallionellales bacterium RIFCSPLOWO2_12_FULL_59_22]